VSRADSLAATGRIPDPPARCECAHLVTLHEPNSKGLRARCQWQPCACRLFVKAGESRG
jgi:hypothetical protein